MSGGTVIYKALCKEVAHILIEGWFKGKDNEKVLRKINYNIIQEWYWMVEDGGMKECYE